MITSDHAAVLPQPEPGLSPADVVERARALRPLLLEQHEETIERGAYSPELHERFRQAGFYRILQPKRFGGYEFDLPTFFRVIMEISAGDPGAGWCLSLASAHVLPVASHFSAEAQAEFFGDDGEFAAPHSATARGTAVPVDGGYIVSGDWRYSSGIPYSTHFLGTAQLVAPDAGEPYPEVVVIVPRGGYTILDDWGGDLTLGLQGSGSYTAEIRDLFVPEHHVVPWNWLGGDVDAGTPGTKLHGNPMYLGQCGALYAGEIGSVMVGAARAAIDEFEHVIRTRKTQFPPIQPRALDVPTQRTLGSAIAWTDAAEACLIHAGETYMDQCQTWLDTGVAPTPAETLRLATTIQTAMRLCWETEYLLFTSAGSSVTRRGERTLKYFKDLAMAQPQRAEAFNMMTERVAQMVLGIADEDHE